MYAGVRVTWPRPQAARPHAAPGVSAVPAVPAHRRGAYGQGEGDAGGPTDAPSTSSPASVTTECIRGDGSADSRAWMRDAAWAAMCGVGWVIMDRRGRVTWASSALSKPTKESF